MPNRMTHAEKDAIIAELRQTVADLTADRQILQTAIAELREQYENVKGPIARFVQHLKNLGARIAAAFRRD